MNANVVPRSTYEHTLEQPKPKVMQKKNQLKKIPVEEALAFFRKEGMDVTREETVLILDFLYNLTCMVITEYFEDE